MFAAAGPAQADYFWPSEQLPPPILQSPADDPVIYEGTNIAAGNVRLSHPSAMFDLPPGGLPAIQSVFDVSAIVSLDPEHAMIIFGATANVTLRAAELPIVPPDLSRAFETEMLAMDIIGGGLPAGVMIRESPTRPSLGQTIMRPTAGGVMITCNVNAFTELSLDGGQTWHEASAALHFQGVPEPASVMLLVAGGLGLLVCSWMRRRRRAA